MYKCIYGWKDRIRSICDKALITLRLILADVPKEEQEKEERDEAGRMRGKKRSPDTK
jgi:hypothetical protein